MKALNKKLIQNAKKLLKEKGYDIKTSHLYDVFSQLSGFKNWHVASKKDIDFSHLFETSRAIDQSLLNSFSNFTYFDKSLPNWNTCIAGESEYHKTTLINKILENEFLTESTVHIHSYNLPKWRYKLPNFQYIELHKQEYSINILELDNKSSIPTPKKIEKIKQALNDPQVSTKDILDYYQYNKVSFKIIEELTLKDGECEPTNDYLDIIIEMLNNLVYPKNKIEEQEAIEILKDFLLNIYRNTKNPSLDDLFLAPSDPILFNFLNNIKKTISSHSFFGNTTSDIFSKDLLEISYNHLKNDSMYKGVMFLFLQMKLQKHNKSYKKLIIDDQCIVNVYSTLRTTRVRGLGFISVVNRVADYKSHFKMEFFRFIQGKDFSNKYNYLSLTESELKTVNEYIDKYNFVAIDSSRIMPIDIK